MTHPSGVVSSAACSDKMEHQISQQLLTFGQSILLGLLLGALYDLLRPFRLHVPRCTPLLDGLYCLTTGSACFLFILHRGNGDLRGFLLLGMIGGSVLFFAAFSSLLRPIWAFWAETLSFLIYLLSFPLFLAKVFCKKTLWFGKNLFYFIVKCYTIKKSGRIYHAQRRKLWPEKKTPPNPHGPDPAC